MNKQQQPSALKVLIDRCKKDAEVLAMTTLMQQAELAAAELTDMQNEIAALRIYQSVTFPDLKAALEAAKLYISVNVCDQDTTAEMWQAWQAYQEALSKVTA